MTQAVTMLQGSSFICQLHSDVDPLVLPQTSCMPYNNFTKFWKCRGLRKVLGTAKCHYSKSRFVCRKLLNLAEKCHVHVQDRNCDTSESNYFLHVQTLRNFPLEKLRGEVVIVRFDSAILLEQLCVNSVSVNKALSTISYLYNSGAKVLLVSNWGRSSDYKLLSTESVAGSLSSLLGVNVVPANGLSNCVPLKSKELGRAEIILLDNLSKFKEELANCTDFAQTLASGVYVFVNDAFSLSHKILASTVGVTRFCCASVAGFHLEEELFLLTKVAETTRQPYMAIIGGRNFLEKAAALHLLASRCDGLIFVGTLAFQIMHALGLPVPACFLERDATGEVLKLIQLARNRNIPIYYPDDLWCLKDCNSKLLRIFPSDGITNGWTPVDLGPKSLKEIFYLISKCKKILWIGPVKFGSVIQDTNGASELALILKKISRTGCDVTVVGNAACKAVAGTSSFHSNYKLFQSASVVWEFLKGRTLPGVAALDRAYPFDLDWENIYTDPSQPLIVDVGSGNGMFLLAMTKRWKDSNFLGLDMNNKLVKRCLDCILESNIKNGYFISTNATSTFRSIISSYPGDLALVSIQCPNPDFNKKDYRWRMVQRILIEAITDLLKINGKVYLQSDIEAVAIRMKEQFIMYGNGELVVDGEDEKGWISHNPFGARSDWEQHVLDRGDPMYRVMLRKICRGESS